MAADVYVITSEGMRNLYTGDVVEGDTPAGDGLGFAALGSGPLGE